MSYRHDERAADLGERLRLAREVEQRRADDAAHALWLLAECEELGEEGMDAAWLAARRERLEADVAAAEARLAEATRYRRELEAALAEVDHAAT